MAIDSVGQMGLRPRRSIHSHLVVIAVTDRAMEFRIQAPVIVYRTPWPGRHTGGSDAAAAYWSCMVGASRDSTETGVDREALGAEPPGTCVALSASYPNNHVTSYTQRLCRLPWWCRSVLTGETLVLSGSETLSLMTLGFPAGFLRCSCNMAEQTHIKRKLF